MTTVLPLAIPEVLLLQTTPHHDERGWFRELWRQAVAAGQGLPPFVQDNCSASRAGVLRGLHFQHQRPQGKLITVLQGAIYDVAVDLRRDADTFGRWVAVELRAGDGRQLYIPPGFAHGLLALEDAIVHYKCTEYYDPALDAAVRWDDPDIGIAWPVARPQLSRKDAGAPLLKETSY